MRYFELFEAITAYHGTSMESPVSFLSTHQGNNSHTFGSYNSDRHGTFFTTNPKYAALYGEVSKYKLNIKNTAKLDGTNIIYDFVKSLEDDDDKHNVYMDARGIMYDNYNPWHLFEDEVGEEFVKYLKSVGYDSATFEEWMEDDNGKELKSKTIVVLYPKLIWGKGVDVQGDLFEKDLFGVSTPSPEEIAKKHGVTIGQIMYQLEKGTKVEKEHTLDEPMAREIALDHLNEFPDYYDRLEKVEECAGVGKIVKGVNTTPDVGVDEIKKQAKKFGFDVDSNGVPKTNFSDSAKKIKPDGSKR